MNITIKQELLLKALQWVTSVSDKKHHLPILANVLIIAENDKISLICTDLDLELVTTIDQGVIDETGEITVSSRKLLDICRSFPENTLISILTEESRVLVRAGRSRFVLASLPAVDFPAVQLRAQGREHQVSQKTLHEMITRTHFAMAQQDVRYYLNGMLFVLNNALQQVVATDGHRLAITKNNINQTDTTASAQQVIVPRKAISELLKLMSSDPQDLTVYVEENHIRFIHPLVTLTSKLIEGRFPDYLKVIPPDTPYLALIHKDTLKQSLMRAAILSNEKHKGALFTFKNNQLTIEAQNPEQELAQEELEIEYAGPPIEIGFNAHYILDVLNVLPSDNVCFSFSDPKNSVLLSAQTQLGESVSQYVVMPLRL
jgi:DNA polymerase III subunit beta